jgi:NAD(P)-dependent dehydrogenase (short-subunit alcohol dehydrogenase family)
MASRTVLITGASSGVGLATSLLLAEQGAEVIMICRDPVRGKFMRSQVAKYATESSPSLFIADLSSQAEIRRLAVELRGTFHSIDVLINNAGAMFARCELTPEGIEKTLALNHLAPFLLTLLLLDLVQAAPAGRIINVTSEFHSGSLDFHNLQGERHYNFLTAYHRSKLCNILFTYELARRLTGTRATANCLSPGPTMTRLGDNMSGLPAMISRLMKTWWLVFPERGAQTTVYVASSPDLDSVSGRFLLRCRETRTKRITYDTNVARCLWYMSTTLLEDSPGEIATKGSIDGTTA